MIEVSGRHALSIAILVTLALLPEFVHRGARFLREDCRDPGALLRSVGVDGPAPAAPEALLRMRGTQLAARRVPLPEGEGHLEFHVVHGFNPSLIYLPAEQYFVADRKPDRREIEMLEHDGVRLPVHRAYHDQPPIGRERYVTGYLQIFDAKPVENAFAAELWAAPRQLFTGRQPIWVFFVHGRVKSRESEAAERALHGALTTAWDAYRAACLPQATSG